MTPEFKRQWVEALRSGKYEQQRLVLRGQEGFCCIGVACQLMGPTKWRVEGDSFVEWDDTRTNSLRHLDHQFGLDMRTLHKLADMNDGTSEETQKSFAEIADYIDTLEAE